MSFLLDLINMLGFGESVMIAAMLGVAAFYLIKGKSLAATIGGVIGSATGYLVVSLLVLAVVVGLGWVDPAVATAKQQVGMALSWVADIAGDIILDRLAEVLP